jgi:hypothetical protein
LEFHSLGPFNASSITSGPQNISQRANYSEAVAAFACPGIIDNMATLGKSSSFAFIGEFFAQRLLNVANQRDQPMLSLVICSKILIIFEHLLCV